MFCQKCGTVVPDGSSFCSNCGARFDDHVQPGPGGWYYPQEQRDSQASEPNQGSGYSGQHGRPGGQDQMNPFIRRERDTHGRAIPREYPANFNRGGWCWPGFMFPALWCCYKGIYNAAWKYILIGLIPYVGASIVSIWCGVVGYSEYASFIEKNPPSLVNKSKSTGMGCFWALLIIGIIAQIVIAILAVALVLKSANIGNLANLLDNLNF